MELSKLLAHRDNLLKKIRQLGDMRNGTLSIRYQRCSKSPCVCDDPKHPGHGPIYSFSTVINGKTKIKNYKLGPGLDKLHKEMENYQTFKKLSRDLITTNNQICDLRPLAEIRDEKQLEEIKKKLRWKLTKKWKKR